jgi:hypothetical protein
MKIFLSWSGPRSRAIAEALNDWLRRVIQAVKPFYSPEIEKGAKWSGEIDSALEGTSFGIVCLTPDNLDSTWIHFEAGALSKTKDASIWTFLHGLAPGDVPQPLGKFQHTVADKDDTLSLLRTINRRLGEVGGESLSEKMLEENFETFWPQLKEKLEIAEKISESKSRSSSDGSRNAQRAERALLDEILELVRNQERRLSEFSDRLVVNRLEPVLSTPRRIRVLEVPLLYEETKDADDIADQLIKFLTLALPNVEASKLLSKAGPIVHATFSTPITKPVLDAFLAQARIHIGNDFSHWQAMFA